MSDSDYGFYFEKAGRAATQGAIAPAEQFFEGSLAEESLARETGQNSLDARAGDGPVTMVFELGYIATDEIPDIERLRRHLAQVAVDTRGSQGHDRMRVAHETASSDEIAVLRIADYNTTGLRGSESINDPQSALSALTRGAGISAADGSRGGSFGIGSAVGPMASDMGTVLYTSLPHDSNEVVFAGYSRLASHRDVDGVWRMGDGFFTDLAVEDDFRYLRNPAPLGPFAVRTEPGTDVYVLGYRKAEADPKLQHIKLAFLNNFLPAIHRGRLVVQARTSSGEWQLDSTTLGAHVQESPEAAAFFRALHDPDPVTMESPRFGRVSLRVNVDDSLERSLHTITCRKPLMKIDTFRHTSIPIKYAAILECSDDRGNTLLRSLEPPQHHRWDPERAPDGRSALKELKDFVREGLKTRVKEQIGEQVEIKGLAKFLPATVVEDGVLPGNEGAVPVDEEGSETESATVHGADSETRPVFNSGRKSVRVGVRTAADANGDAPVTKGKDRGGEGTRTATGGGLPGEGGPGDGNARISAGDIRFRSWTDAATGDLCLALTAREDITGDIELVALGPGGAMEDDYTLPISAARILANGTATPITHADNVLKDFHLVEGVTTQVRLTFSTQHRYRLGVR